MTQSTKMLIMHYLIAITMIPVGVELFGRTGKILLGEAAIALHPWLETFFAYVPILILVLIYTKATLEPFSKYGLVWKTDKWKMATIIGAISALVIYGIDIMFGILDSFGIPADPSLAVAIGYVLAFVVLVPFTEELLFRGVIQTVFTNRIKKAYTIHPAIFIATGFEVLMHLSVPLYFAPDGAVVRTMIATAPQLLYVFVFGSIGGWIYSKTHSLVGPMLIHAIGNLGELLLFWMLV